MKQLFLAIILIAVPVALFSGYEVYAAQTLSVGAPAGLGDLSSMQTIVADVQKLADAGDFAGAAKRITDFESAWDQGETAIRPLNPTYWGNIDDAADAALHAIRAASPDQIKIKDTLAGLMATLTDPSKPAA